MRVRSESAVRSLEEGDIEQVDDNQTRRSLSWILSYISELDQKVDDLEFKPRPTNWNENRPSGKQRVLATIPAGHFYLAVTAEEIKFLSTAVDYFVLNGMDSNEPEYVELVTRIQETFKRLQEAGNLPLQHDAQLIGEG